jgi:hypothetical protein
VNRSNVYPFRNNPASAPTWRTRVLTSLTYLFFAYEFPQVQTGALINLLMLLSILYWAFVQQKKASVPYFVRYHWLHCLMLMAFVGVGLELLMSACGVVEAGLQVLHLSALIPFGFVTGILYVGGALIKSVGLIVMAILAGLGKSPTLPIVSEPVKRFL